MRFAVDNSIVIFRHVDHETIAGYIVGTAGRMPEEMGEKLGAKTVRSDFRIAIKFLTRPTYKNGKIVSKRKRDANENFLFPSILTFLFQGRLLLRKLIARLTNITIKQNIYLIIITEKRSQTFKGGIRI